MLGYVLIAFLLDTTKKLLIKSIRTIYSPPASKILGDIPELFVNVVFAGFTF